MKTLTIILAFFLALPLSAQFHTGDGAGSITLDNASAYWDSNTTDITWQPAKVSATVVYILEYTTSGGPPGCQFNFNQLSVMVYKTEFATFKTLKALGKRVYALSQIGATDIKVWESRRYTGKIVVEVSE